ncbi:MAG: T9SS type A sorting domain-containing protein, partial [Crocinitomicaceae bacterium]|nr:T9SS type A sorting domain-containing protein [Crocinitomicaceae bacterium]
DFTIYPNPASDILFIKTIEQKVNYKLWTQSGTQVGEGMVSDKIDISKLSKGSYFIEIIGIRPRVFCFSKE